MTTSAKTADDVWTRARRQFEANRTGNARNTLGYAAGKPDPGCQGA